MVNRRNVLKGGLAAITAGAVGMSVTGTSGAQAGSDGMLVNEFESDSYPGTNAVDEWTNHAAFDDAALEDGALRLEYDDGGFFGSVLLTDVSAYERLELVVRGDDGGEEDDIDLRVGDVRAQLSELTDDSIGTEFDTVSIDLEEAGVSRSAVRQLRLGFWHDASGAIELEEIAFVGDGDGNGEDPPQVVTEEMTLAEYYEDYEYGGTGDAVEIDEYFPGELGDGHGDHDQVNWPDEEKADYFNVDLEAIEDGARDGSVTFGEMGDVVINHVTQLEEEGVPRQAIVQLLPRLIFLPEETEELTLHNGPPNYWDEMYGPQEATNDPDTLIQDPWPPDARSYDPDEVAIRDRAHDQPQHEDQEGWTENDLLSDDRYYDDDNPIHLLGDDIHPATEEPLGGDGFTANAPMNCRATVHEESDAWWYQILEFENLSPVPYHLNAAVIMWIGPSGANGDLRTGHYNNEQRPQPGWGHPQRDVIEVMYDEEQQLSAYAVRIAFHDEPYNMRTAYPNQRWSLEIGMSANDHFDDEQSREELVQTMVESCHVEVETDMDRNDDLLDALDLRNRMTN
ncbi:hypothetical protein G6M89_07240 [Natronolimnobius sp. AArcel1]|uniref:twin-arginine translocation signal domain-containing protein n=1 Tax=Natronolimnobius sp. AArcel1 TaxID=1679093 RepID=UPI0013EC4BBB|nr:twin-arginine translocation signal domain-containing protein [Natronolimnobius sp. AArcel1]NGM68804.1 hypothetical protein [Natronolimnobius sp. AArcel1]